MEMQDLLKSKLFKFFLGVYIVAGIIKIFEAGISVGHWLYQITN